MLERRVQIVTFTTLYPNRAQPRHGIFVEQRLRRLVETQRVVSTVVAPVPWFPFSSPFFGRYAVFARPPRADCRYGIEVRYPRYPVVPKVGMTLAPRLLSAAALREFRKLTAARRGFDAIDAHYFYPDGVAGALLGRRLGKPVVITARGSDVNLYSTFSTARSQILWAAKQCSAIITVSQALKDALVSLGVPDAKISVLRNGVDLDAFSPVDRQSARDELGIDGAGTVLLSVGNLIELKGHHIAIEALRLLPEARLLIVGEGEMEPRLARLVHEHGLGHRVKLVGAVAQERLRVYYSAATALVLASSREGIPNVVLESLACGTPVVATTAGGIPEVVTGPSAGQLMARRDSRALAETVIALLARYPERNATRRFAERFSWDATTRGQLEVFTRLTCAEQSVRGDRRDNRGE